MKKNKIKVGDVGYIDWGEFTDKVTITDVVVGKTHTHYFYETIDKDKEGYCADWFMEERFRNEH